MTTQLTPIVQFPTLGISGAIVSNNATTPNTKLNISAGSMWDSNGVINMNLGNFLGQGNSVLPVNSVTVLDTSVNGLNGLDTGVLAASTGYLVCVVGDSSNQNPTGCILTKAVNAIPLLPFGYDSYRAFGFAVTDSSTHFLKIYQTGYWNSRDLYYDIPQATAVTAGNATSYTAVDLTTLVPVQTGILTNIVAHIFTELTPNAAGNAVFLQGVNATGDQVVNKGQVASVVLNSYNNVIAQISSATVKINYKVTSGSDAVAIKVAGFSYSA